MPSQHSTHGFSPISWTPWCLVATVVMLCAGCQSLPAIVACPLPMVEQAAKVQKIVPLGTSRDDALALMKKAGIEGNFGSNKSVYYCDTWAQSDKELWHINVEMLFDQDGKVYAYRPNPETADVANVRQSGKETDSVKEVKKTIPPAITDPFAE